VTFKIKNWHKFQHFKDRRPPWIKLYRDILDDVDWHDLDPLAAKTLIMLWLIASENDGDLPDIRTISFRLRMPEAQIKSLIFKLKHYLDHDDINAISDRYQADTPETETETESEREKEAETKTRAARGKFDEFWSAYPRKLGIGAAERAWKKATKDDDADRIIARVKDYGWSKDPQYIPHPATWLNQKRWLDDPPKPAEKKETLSQYYARLAMEGEDMEPNILQLRQF
jgi:hypothetical protein